MFISDQYQFDYSFVFKSAPEFVAKFRTRDQWLAFCSI